MTVTENTNLIEKITSVNIEIQDRNDYVMSKYLKKINTYWREYLGNHAL